ncbi:MAG: ATP-binding protein [Candidatus Bathyarchaeota archaeon]|uniref:ATP-binding protein n=1 Tax=Candidatus Bathycorpusculum sp. TaxID=2994959 RepID=UPI002822FE04|nr:ATP-binding protein [Candidatus Termiticorpusculum sp.]MCL2292642.1 ATP-binding protein [Candidatus Termiticorpusculum sp.]
MFKTWIQTNQTHLLASINQVKTLLNNYINHPNEPSPQIEVSLSINKIKETIDVGSSSIETLSLLFGLSPFEKQVIVLCAAQELDPEVRTLLAKAHDNPNITYPTFGLALACLSNVHWSALTPTSPLRRFQLIDINPNNCSITTAPLRIPERILHYLKGINYLDSKLQGMIKPVFDNDQPVKSHLHIVDKILSIWQDNKEKLPIIQLCGVDETGKFVVAQTALAARGFHLWQLSTDAIPQKPQEIASLAQLWTREAALFGAGLLITTEDANIPTQKTAAQFIELLSGPVFLATRERWQTPTNAITLQVNKPLKVEQYQLWQANIQNNDSNLQNTVSALVEQFNFNASTIKAATNEAAMCQNDKNLSAKELLWQSACAVSRPKFLALAQQITPKATLDNLVLPDREKQQLKEIIVHVAQRHKVYEEWGFEAITNRGLGISALFSGSSGTGKTMAAEVIAHELHLELFRIDLAAVVNKYIGETEKNLCKLFDAAEDNGAILFFDEADALFGKRTEIKDSHDRHANIEINYLLQRMENYRGLAILATNMRETLDSAFIRRLKFIINFPFPDEKSRLEIWKHVFPQKTPLSDLNFDQLAKLNIAGGNIRNIALYSAFLAANENTSINMQHIKRATQVEYAKIEKPLTAGNWCHENQS